MASLPSRPKPRLSLSGVLSLPLLGFLALPLVALLLRAVPADWGLVLSAPAVGAALQLSLITSLTATVLAVVLGLPVAYWLSRTHSRPQKLIDTLMDLPTVLPPSVAGLALLMAFGRRGLMGAWLESLGVSLAFTTLAVIMAQLFVSAPLFVKAAAIGLGAVEPELEQAAELDGASRWQVLRYVTLPLAWSGLVSGAVLTWARALGEFGATIIFAGNFSGRTQTMPLAIYLGLESDLSVALALAVILIALAVLALTLVRGLAVRRAGSD